MACKRCAKDPSRRATYRCQRCGGSICDVCTVNARFCSKKCNEKYQTFFGRFGGVLRRRTGMPERVDEAHGHGLAWVIAFGFVGAALAGAVWAHHAKHVTLPAPVGPFLDRALRAREESSSR